MAEKRAGIQQVLDFNEVLDRDLAMPQPKGRTRDEKWREGDGQVVALVVKVRAEVVRNVRAA